MSDRVTWGEGAYAGFWLRVGARLIDWLLVGAVTFVVILVLIFLLSLAVLTGAGTGTGDPGLADGGVGAGITFFFVLLAWLPDFLYDTFMTSRLGWTLGKRAVGIEVRRADGDRLSYGQAAGRYFGRILSGIPFSLGFLWAAWDPRKQTWHDKMVNCFVVLSARATSAGGAAVAVARPWGGQAAWGIPGAAPPPAGTPGYAPGPSPGVAPGTGTTTAAATGVESAGIQETDWARELSWDTGSPSGTPGGAHDGGSEPTAPDAWPAEPEPEVAPEPELGVAPEPEPEVAPGAELEAAPEPELGVAPEPELGVAPGAEHEVAEPEPDRAGAETQQWGSNDPNVLAVSRAGLANESAGWLDQVASQVDSRLDRIAAQWRTMPHAEAARACAFGLLLGHLATLYAHMSEDLSRVAEAHPSFSTLGTGNRLSTLQSIAQEPGRAAAWLGPLVGVQDPGQVARLLE